MLVLSRDPRERESNKDKVIIRVGEINIVVTAVAIKGEKVRIGFEGPNNVEFIRAELYEGWDSWHEKKNSSVRIARTNGSKT